MAKGATGKAVSPREHAKTSDEISKHNRPTSDVVEHLQKQVANAFILYSNYKHYHWQTFGPLFRDLHLLFDEFAKEVLATIDDFAERLAHDWTGSDLSPGRGRTIVERRSLKRSDNYARDD